MTWEPQTAPAVVHLPVETTVEEARRALQHAGAGLALVTDHGAPVGVVALSDLFDGIDDDEPVGDVVHQELVELQPSTGDLDTLAAYRAAAWASLRRRAPGRPRRAPHWRRSARRGAGGAGGGA